MRVVLGSARAVAKTRLQTSGVPFYLMVWLSFPIFNVLLISLIYRNNPTLQSYAIIAGAGLALLFGMIFNASEILDRERQTGTLGNLFVAPAPRFSWLAGFQLFAVIESLVTATLSVAIGAAVFGLPLDIAPLTLLVTLVLFVTAMWGFSMILGAVGVALRNANQLSNLVFPILQLFAGTLYPIALMTEWVRVPARCLPFGYGIQAMVDSVTKGASLSDVSSDLWPLAGFAVVLPMLGIAAFRAVERRTRIRGTLELV
jgi:ABC-2 type transport system permease protein